MDTTFWQRLDSIARRMLPFAVTVVLAMAAAVPLHLPGFAALAPAVTLISVYYWTIFRPDLMPALAVFAIGLLQDILSGTALGVNALILLLVYTVVLGQRRFFLGKSFLVMWWGFALVVAGAFMAMWMMLSSLDGAILDPLPAVFEGLVTVGLFPVLTRIYIRSQQAMLRGV
jgi:rod shape-determining protein MreD